MRTYRVSALASALVRMWRGWAVIVPVVIVNAILQALLIWTDPTPGDGAVPVLLALASALVFIVAYGLAAELATTSPVVLVDTGGAASAARRRAR